MTQHTITLQLQSSRVNASCHSLRNLLPLHHLSITKRRTEPSHAADFLQKLIAPHQVKRNSLRFIKSEGSLSYSHQSAICLSSKSKLIQSTNPCGGDIFRTRPNRPWGPSSLLYDRHRVSFPRVKRPGRGANYPPPSSAEVKERVALYLYSPSGPTWPLLGRNLHLPHQHMFNYITIHNIGNTYGT